MAAETVLLSHIGIYDVGDQVKQEPWTWVKSLNVGGETRPKNSGTSYSGGGDRKTAMDMVSHSFKAGTPCSSLVARIEFNAQFKGAR